MLKHTSSRWGRIAAVVSAVTVTAALGAAPPVSAASTDYPLTIADAQVAIDEARAASGATSVSAMFTTGDGTVWEGSSGVLDAGGAAPTPETLYGIGSTSKMFATVAIMQLVELGLVALDEPVVTYLPEFTMRSPQYRQITVRMLLDHSAGLPGATYASIFTTQPWLGYADEVLANLASSPLKTTPGAMSVYCNDCFTLAGEVVAAVSGVPFTTYVEENILAPLGMTWSTYALTGVPAGSVARMVADGANHPFIHTNAYASGGLMSTPSEMGSFARMLLNGGETVLTPESVAEMGHSQMATTLNPVTANPYDYGLGWDTVSVPSLEAVGVRAWMKGGDAYDYHAALLVLPDHDLAVYVGGAGLTVDSGRLEVVAQRIALHALAEQGSIPEVPARLTGPQPDIATPTEADITHMLGTYIGAMGAGLRFRRGPDGSLLLDQYRGGAWTQHEGTFTYRVDGAWWPDNGTIASFRVVRGWGRAYLMRTTPDGYGNAMGQLLLGQRLTSAGSTASAWKQRVGQWFVTDDRPDSVAWFGDPSLRIDRIPGLGGYMYVAGQFPFDARQADIGTMFLQVPIAFGRDQNDVVPIGPGLLQMGATVLRDPGTVPVLTAGSSTVRIAGQGYAVWRRVGVGGELAVRGATEWKLYDGDLAMRASGAGRATDVQAQEGDWLVLFGVPRSQVRVALAPA